MRRALPVPLLAVLGAAVWLAGCANVPTAPMASTRTVSTAALPRPGATAPAAPKPEAKSAEADKAERYRIYPGTGEMVRQGPRETAVAGPETASLFFEGADVREAVKTILFDILKENYLIDPQVQGTVTFRTVRPIPRSALIPTLETILRMNGAALVREAGILKVVPAALAVRGTTTPQLGGGPLPLPNGFSVRIIPLRYVGVREMLRILEPFAKDASSIRADELRNLLVLSGTERELQHLTDTVATFDVDWMSGMSAGLFTLRSVDVRTVMTEIERLFGDRTLGPLAGLVRVVPIERMNALLVVSPQRHIVEQAKVWIERLDQGGDAGGQRLNVYQLQYGRAEKLAPLLQQAITGRAPAPAPAQPSVAPGLPAGLLTSPLGPALGQQTPPATPPPTTPAPTQAQAQAALAARAAAGADVGVAAARNVQIIADKDNNAIIVLATAGEWAIVESAIKKLDIAPRQVLIEATIAEVLLTDDLELGLQWALSRTDPNGIIRLFGQGVDSSGQVTPSFAGLGFLWKGLSWQGFALDAAINMLANAGKAKIVSRPHIVATDNQKASIQVGDRVPTNVGAITGGTTGGQVVTATQYLDTGIQLSVTPHINESGQITLDLQTEVSAATKTTSSNIDSPTITQRKAQSVVTVQSAETILLGGLIRDDLGEGSSGVPFLSQIPYVGWLFGSQTYNRKRTELVILLTPRVIGSVQQLRDITDELRRKMQGLQEAFPAPSAEAPAAEQTSPSGTDAPAGSK